jgi:Flp pilus assembly protein TadD
MDQAAPAAAADVRPPGELLRIAHEYEATGRYAEAEHLLHAVLRITPQDPDALHLMGLLAYRRNRLTEAARLIEQAIARNGRAALYFRNLCTIYEEAGRYEEAVRAGQRATGLDPYDPHAHHNLSVAHYRSLQLEESVACARRAIGLAPGLAAPHLGLAEALLLGGNLEAGWAEYEWRFRVPASGATLPQIDRPHWDGAAIGSGTLLLIADQGFGDVLQFCRYIPWAIGRCPDAALACGPEMAALMRHCFPGLSVFHRWDQCPDIVAYCPLSGLPRLHGTRLDTIPGDVPYLAAPPDRLRHWQRRLDGLLPPGLLRVGIAWNGRPRPPNRSAHLRDFAPLAALDGIALVSVQTGPAQEQLGSYYGRAPLLGLGHEIGDFADTAAILSQLDLVISVDTAVAHLAGALGRPAWVMLPRAPDWRWLLGREDSPWYPTMRLFRQQTPRDWRPVMHAMAERLPQMVLAHGMPNRAAATPCSGPV